MKHDLSYTEDRRSEADLTSACARELVPVAPHAAERAGPQRHGAGGVGDEGSDAESDDGGKSEQRAAARDSIHGARRRGGDEREHEARGGHATSVAGCGPCGHVLPSSIVAARTHSK